MLNSPYKLFDQLKDQLEPGRLFVEIGSERGGGSTYYFSNLSRQTLNDFVTVDIDPVYLGPNIQAVTMSGEEWVTTNLPEMGKKISLVFLDGFDWVAQPMQLRSGTVSPDVYNAVDEYAKKGLVLNNINCAVAHMKQINGMLPYMDDKCVVMFCDTWFNYTLDAFEGKGAGAVYLLLTEGFEIISSSYKSNYVMLARNMRPNAPMPNLNQARLAVKYEGPKQRPDALLYDNVE